MTHRRRMYLPGLRTWIALAAALLLSAVLAACGGDDSDERNDHFGKSELDRNQQAPDFTLPTATGETVSLSDYTSQGQPVMLFFHMAAG